MALDTWLFEQHCQGQHPPTLRFYTWEPIALSLGYHQHRYPAAWHHLTHRGQAIDLVRRPSGGRAVLHQGDLTYAVIASGFADRRVQAYQQVCQFLIEGWRSLGVPLAYGQAGRGYIHNPDCFGTATGADLVLPNGAKFIGSAQLRRGSALLQHGSMRLQPDRALFQQVFGEVGEDVLQAVRAIEVGQAIDALTIAARRCFQVEFNVQPLSASEWQALQPTVQRFSQSHAAADPADKLPRL